MDAQYLNIEEKHRQHPADIAGIADFSVSPGDALDPDADTEASLSALREAFRAPYLAPDEVTAQLRKLGFDTRLFTPGPPSRMARLSMLM